MGGVLRSFAVDVLNSVFLFSLERLTCADANRTAR